MPSISRATANGKMKGQLMRPARLQTIKTSELDPKSGRMLRSSNQIADCLELANFDELDWLISCLFSLLFS